MESVAWISNGVFYHKQQWGARPQADPYAHEQLLFRADRLSPEWRHKLNKIGFITVAKNRYFQVCIANSEPEYSDAAAVSSALKHGLEGIFKIEEGQAHIYDADNPNSKESVNQ